MKALAAQQQAQAAAAQARTDFSQELAALGAAGAQTLDPVRLHYLQALAQRAQAQPASVRRLLEAKLALAVQDLRARLEQAALEPQAHHPAAARPPVFATPTPLGELVRALAHAMPEPGAPRADAPWGATPPARDELQSVRHFRSTWSRLSSERQVAQALQQAPKNAGPINSHMLVLRSLAQMRALAPDYLSHFISYADTLLCLAPDSDARTASPKPGPALPAGKKPRARRARPA